MTPTPLHSQAHQKTQHRLRSSLPIPTLPRIFHHLPIRPFMQNLPRPRRFQNTPPPPPPLSLTGPKTQLVLISTFHRATSSLFPCRFSIHHHQRLVCLLGWRLTSRSLIFFSRWVMHHRRLRKALIGCWMRFLILGTASGYDLL